MKDVKIRIDLIAAPGKVKERVSKESQSEDGRKILKLFTRFVSLILDYAATRDKTRRA